jgi:hypothetical protein
MVFDDDCPECGGQNICSSCGRCFTCEDNDFIKLNEFEKLKGLLESIINDIEVKPASLHILNNIKLIVKGY